MTAGPYTPGAERKLILRNPLFVFALGFALFPSWLLLPLGGASYIAYSDMMVVFSAYYLVARRSVGLPTLGYMYMFYLLAALLSCFGNILMGYENSPAPSAQVVRAFAIFFPFWAMFQLRHFDEAMLRRVVQIATIGGAIAVFAGVLIFELGIQVREDTRKLWLGNGQGFVVRAGGLAGNSGSYGMLLAVWTTVVFILRPALGMRLPWWMVIAAALLIAHGFQTSSSRGGLLQVMVALGLYAVLILPARPSRLLIAAMVAAVIAAILTFVIASTIQDNPGLARSIARLDIFNLTGQSVFFQTVRLSNWGALPSLIAENWAIGTGFKQFESTYGFHIDNAYLLSFFESGLLAFLFFVIFWFGLVLHGVALMAGGNIHARLFLIVLVPFMVRLFTGGANTNWSIAPVVFVLLGALYRMAVIRNAELRQAAL